MTEARLTGSVSDTLADFSSRCTLPPRSKYSTLDDQDREYIKLLFSKLNPSSSQEAIPNTVFRKYLHTTRNGKTIGYFGSRQKTAAPCVVMAEWDRNLFGPPLTAVADPFHPALKFRPVKIHHFAKLSIQVREHA